MNLMFRKTFGEQKAGVAAIKGNKISVCRHTSKRSREQGYTAMEEHHYRTHLFFSPPRCSFGAADEDGSLDSTGNAQRMQRAILHTEPRCGPMTGTGGESPPMQSTISPAMTESDLPQPLVVRSPSVSLMKWPNQLPTKATPTRQVNFNYGNESSHVDAQRALSELDKDCFIIPVHSLDRFLPAGVPIPKPVNNNSLDKKGNLHVMEVPDPKLCVLCHLMSPLEPVDPVLESPLVQPLLKQRVIAGELVNDIAQAKTAVTGMLLANMERNAEFPFITYYVINTSQTNPVMFYNNLRTASLSKFDPRTTRYTAAHTLDLYTEVASICRPPVHEIGMSLQKTHSTSTGYLVSVYKVFEGDDREKFERNWLYWTGARMIYRYLPHAAGLRRISLHKSLSPKGDKMYILLCECANLLEDVTVCALILPALRARLTGYTGLFRPLQTF
ncbi:uncharacterized protein LOC130898837 isoform X1 [Diorhabda carinulata]|uniref:uncharacterized protein LOC130442491 isoform X1 n=1 Tax=Diorhabda sublineata TaxID=1163346 RepID=UPI0024E13876|nr:uncharacterized protein LOC130442491 isoform X1 [Diorhabda sublineata]XP_057664361.1 uncharacterized protein LOC130898837 isoform X1 [Diorhabda carinulata]XP_057664362.1 uncharacterized protein LOC130898837 isoform X1 [Diorhabda carinulata]